MVDHFILSPRRLWERKERVTEQVNQGEDEKKKKRKRRLQIHPRTVPLPKLPHSAVPHKKHTAFSGPPQALNEFSVCGDYKSFVL